MNDSERRELLEDVFEPGENLNGTTAGDILRLVGAARAKRRRARQIAGTAAAILVSAALVWTFLVAGPGNRRPANIASATLAPAAIASSQTAPPPAPPSVERVNDEQMLALLEDTPAALIRWPNGRQSLLVLARPK